uniref:Transcription elongation factor 1 homolog n=1 Tax=Cynoglossus semilaevis TaxID=244447 RepID=A0A3P8W452_CYNSE
MGRRKSKRKPPPKKKMTGDLDTQFTCPFCNHEKACDVKMERSRNTGIISCTVCLEEFQTPITCTNSLLHHCPGHTAAIHTVHNMENLTKKS